MEDIVYKSIDDLPEATRGQVLELWAVHPEYQRLILEDLRSLGRPVTAFEFVANFTRYVVDPNVGVMPTYVFDDLHRRNPEWNEGFGFGGFDRAVYKVLWFGVWDAQDDDVFSTHVFPLEKMEEHIKQAETDLENSDVDFFAETMKFLFNEENEFDDSEDE